MLKLFLWRAFHYNHSNVFEMEVVHFVYILPFKVSLGLKPFLMFLWKGN